MNTFIILKPQYQHRYYVFNKYLGFTRIKKKVKNSKIHLNPKIIKGLRIVDNPYSISIDNLVPIKKDIKITFLIKTYGLLLIILYKYFYIGLWILSHFNFNLFENSVIACDVFYKIHPKDQKVLCLPRSIFAATTSKNFQRNGILIIGGFFPSHQKHAWVMENGKNSWRGDNIWINYTPMAILG